jgi:hypothetical protein
MDHRCKCSEKLRSGSVMGAAAGQGCHINDIERRHFNRIAPAAAGAPARGLPAHCAWPACALFFAAAAKVFPARVVISF